MATFDPFSDWDISEHGGLLKRFRDYIMLRVGDGLLTALTTTVKTSLVAAINEVNAGGSSLAAYADEIAARSYSSAVTSAGLGDGTTDGYIKSTINCNYRIGAKNYVKAATDDLWNLSAETDTIADQYRAYALELSAVGAATFVAGTNAASEEAAIEAVAEPGESYSRIGYYIAGPETDFDGAVGLAAQGTIVDGWA